MTWWDFAGGILLFVALFIVSQKLIKKGWNFRSFWPWSQAKELMERVKNIFPKTMDREDEIRGRKDI